MKKREMWKDRRVGFCLFVGFQIGRFLDQLEREYERGIKSNSELYFGGLSTIQAIPNSTPGFLLAPCSSMTSGYAGDLNQDCDYHSHMQSRYLLLLLSLQILILGNRAPE